VQKNYLYGPFCATLILKYEIDFNYIIHELIILNPRGGKRLYGLWGFKSKRWKKTYGLWGGKRLLDYVIQKLITHMKKKASG